MTYIPVLDEPSAPASQVVLGLLGAIGLICGGLVGLWVLFSFTVDALTIIQEHRKNKPKEF
jgi:hypothetical protein